MLFLLLFFLFSFIFKFFRAFTLLICMRCMWISQNHRRLRLEGASGDCAVQIPDQSRVSYSWLLGVLNISKDRESITSLGNVLQYSANIVQYSNTAMCYSIVFHFEPTASCPFRDSCSVLWHNIVRERFSSIFDNTLSKYLYYLFTVSQKAIRSH